MAAQVVALNPNQDREAHFEATVRRAVALSFPLYTYKELKRIVRCEYHRFVDRLRQDHTWSEICVLTGMTRAGLNKLGDEIVPKTGHSVIRTTLCLLQGAGSEGMTLAELASRFYEACPDLDDGPSLKEALHALVEAGEVTKSDGRFVAKCEATLLADPDLPGRVEATVRRIAEVVDAEGGRGAAQMDRISFRVPADRDRAAQVMVDLRQALIELATRVETELDTEGQWLTVVLAGAPGIE